MTESKRPAISVEDVANLAASKLSTTDRLAAIHQRTFGLSLPDAVNAQEELFGDGEAGLLAKIYVIALAENLGPRTAQLLAALCSALEGRGDRPWKLELRGGKRGPRRLGGAEKRLERSRRDLAILGLVDWITDRCGKQEAAIAEVGKMFEIERAAVFASLGRARAIKRRLEAHGQSDLFRQIQATEIKLKMGENWS